MDLVIKGIVVGVVVIAIGLFARKGNTAMAALLIQIPIFSLSAFWVASEAGRETTKEVVAKALLAAPVWVCWVLSVYALLRFSSFPVWASIAVGLVVWLVLAFLYLKIINHVWS